MQKKSISIVFMGDSITFGQYVHPSVRWTSLIEDNLRRHFDVNSANFICVNRGVSGETTRMGLERFPAAVQAAAPDVVTIQYGLNDCNCWETDRGLPRVSERAFKANLAEMILRARVFEAKQIILSNNHRTLRRTKMGSGKLYEEANNCYSELVREVALENHVAFCDIRKSFESFSDGELESLLLPYPDQLHLSEDGNKVYSEIIWPFIKQAVNTVLHERMGE